MSTFGDTTAQDSTAQDMGPQDMGPQDSTPRDSTPWENTPGSAPSGRPPLRRAYRGRMIAGVCAGISDYLGIDVTIVRVAFAVFTFAGGFALPAYLACLLLIPEEGSDESIAGAFINSVQHGL
jgi:phage shock protein C